MFPQLEVNCGTQCRYFEAIFQILNSFLSAVSNLQIWIPGLLAIDSEIQKNVHPAVKKVFQTAFAD